MTQGNQLMMRSVPSPTPELSKSLSPQKLEEHRTRIGREVQIILSAYFQPRESPDVIAGQIAWWCDELEDWTIEQIVWAMRKWNRDNPYRRPTVGHIVKMLKAARGAKLAGEVKRQAAQEPPVDRVDPETAARILKEAGFAPKRMSDPCE